MYNKNCSLLLVSPQFFARIFTVSLIEKFPAIKIEFPSFSGLFSSQQLFFIFLFWAFLRRKLQDSEEIRSKLKKIVNLSRSNRFSIPNKVRLSHKQAYKELRERIRSSLDLDRLESTRPILGLVYMLSIRLVKCNQKYQMRKCVKIDQL